MAHSMQKKTFIYVMSIRNDEAHVKAVEMLMPENGKMTF